MTLPASGALSMSAINTELGRTSNTANTSLSDQCDGDYGTINIANLNDNKPDGSTPHVMGQFYKYEHSVTLGTTPASFSEFSNGSHSSAGTITVTHAEYSTWYVSSKPTWVTITSGNEGSGLADTGDGTVTFSVAANSGSARSGNIVVKFDVGTTGGGFGDANDDTVRSTAVSQAAASGGGGGGGGSGRGNAAP